MEEATLVKEMSTPLYNAKGWMKLIGVMSIIYGIILIATVVGIVVCWLPIWIGVLLIKSGNSIEVAQSAGDKQKFFESLTKIKTYFTITGVLTLIGLIVIGISLIVTGGSFIGALSSFSNY
jgi:uncharacterized membrane protein HdeD (DUF308 family)